MSGVTRGAGAKVAAGAAAGHASVIARVRRPMQTNTITMYYYVYPPTWTLRSRGVPVPRPGQHKTVEVFLPLQPVLVPLCPALLLLRLISGRVYLVSWLSAPFASRSVLG
eukprot:1249011-Rhodomonas_salina.2